MELRDNAITTILPILMLSLAILGLYRFLPTSLPGAPSGAITMQLEGAKPYVSGSSAALHASSTCGVFDLLLDGRKIWGGDSYAFIPLSLSEGSHTFEARGGNCTSTLSFSVAAVQCSGNQTENCQAGSCGGVRTCANGVYSECIMLPRVCVPGERIGCSVDGCEFGHAICNACGTGFGVCTPDATDSSSGNAGCSTGAICN